MTYNINYATPSANPVAILRNGAWLWDEAKAAAVAAADPFAVVCWPRALAEAAAQEAAEKAAKERAEAAAQEAAEKAAKPVVTGPMEAAVVVRGFPYRAEGAVYSDGTFKAKVYDDFRNFICFSSGKADAAEAVIVADVVGWLEHGE